MSDVIYNETGIGDLKGKTPNYNFNIPYFDIATWHDYIEENFRSIDALFHYIYEIKQYKGKWENNTTYKVDDVLFIIDDNSEFNGRLVKVLIEHTTSDKTFDEFYAEHNEYYELFLDAIAAHEFAIEAKTASDIAKEAEENCQRYTESAFNSMQQANNSAIQSKDSENNAFTYKNEAEISKNSAKDYEHALQLCPYIRNNVKISKNQWTETNTPSNLSELFKNTYPYQVELLYDINDDSWKDKFFNGTLTGLVSFTPNDVIIGNFAPVCYVGGSYRTNKGPSLLVYLYSKVIPEEIVTIPSIFIYWREQK